MNTHAYGNAEPSGACAASQQQTVPALELSNMRVKRILVAVNYSEASKRALELVVSLAKKLEAEIVLVHVFEGVPAELKVLEACFVDTSLREEARQALSDWHQQLSSIGGFGVQSIFREGTVVARNIIEAAKESRADLLVIGRHGRNSLFVENTNRKVLKEAPCPVLVGP